MGGKEYKEHIIFLSHNLMFGPSLDFHNNNNNNNNNYCYYYHCHHHHHYLMLFLLIVRTVLNDWFLIQNGEWECCGKRKTFCSP